MRSPALVALLLGTLPAAAQTPMSAETFRALTEGRTLYFTLNGQPFGAEQYFPGQRILWRFDGGACRAGSWHAEGEHICFLYEGDTTAQCWYFNDTGTGLRASLIAKDTAPPFALDFSHSDTTPLTCPGPEIGS